MNHNIFGIGLKKNLGYNDVIFDVFRPRRTINGKQPISQGQKDFLKEHGLRYSAPSL
jgi:hypothetical protein